MLEPWLQVMFEIFKDLTPEVARAGVYAGLGDALKTGCTTSNDLFYPHPVEGLVEATILAAEEIGIRFHPNRGFESLASNIVPPEIISAPEEIIADTERLVKRYHDPSRFSMCRVGVAPSMPQYGTLESLRAALDLAEKYDLLVHGHLAESRYETEFTLEKFGLAAPLNGSGGTTCWASASTTRTASTSTRRRCGRWRRRTPASRTAPSPTCS